MLKARFDQMMVQVEALRRRLKGKNRADILRYLTFEMISGPGLRSALHSPYRQCQFLSALVAGMPEGSDYLSPAEWSACRGLLNNIFAQYGEMYRDLERPDDVSEELWQSAVSVTPYALSHYLFTNRIFCFTSQQRDRFVGVLGQLDRQLRELGFGSAQQVDRWSQAVHQTFQVQADAYSEALRIWQAAQVQLHQRCRGRGLSKKQVGRLPEKRSLDSAYSRLHEAWGKFLHLPEKLFDGPIERNCLELLLENNLADERITPSDTQVGKVPAVFRVHDRYYGSYILTWYDTLYERLLSRLIDAGQGEAVSDAKATYLENQTEVALTELGGRVYRSYAEHPDSTFEHDFVLVCGRRLILVECKSAPLGEVFRDPVKGYVRLLRNFGGPKGPKGGYEQAMRIVNTLESEGICTLYGGSGEILELRREDFDSIGIIVVTLDNYGYLSVDPSMILRMDSDKPHPVVMHLHNLESLVMAWRSKGWGCKELAVYVDERQKLAGKMRASEELEVAAVFLQAGTLQALIEKEVDLIFLGPEATDYIQAIHDRQTGRTNTTKERPFEFHEPEKIRSILNEHQDWDTPLR